MEGVFDDLKKDPNTLPIRAIPGSAESAMRRRLTGDKIIAPQDPAYFLMRLILGAVAVRDAQPHGEQYIPLSRGVLSQGISDFHELIGPLRECQKTGTELASANRHAEARRKIGLPTDHEGIEKLKERCENQCAEVAVGFDKLVDNLASGIAGERAAEKAEEEVRLLEEKKRHLEKKLQSMAITPIYTSKVCKTLHDTAFTAWVQHLPPSNELTEEHLSVFQWICEWITAVDELTDKFAATAGYYAAFYTKFHSTLPLLPTPEKFAARYPEIATGLER